MSLAIIIASSDVIVVAAQNKVVAGDEMTLPDRGRKASKLFVRL
jgi:hypothetical protein